MSSFRTRRIPGFQMGGVVRETGLAIVHKGERIEPAPGSEAKIEPVMLDGRDTRHYYFPAEIVFVGSLPAEERAALESRIWEQLQDAIERLA